MTCLEAQRFIRPFLEETLSDQQTKQFLDHVEHCQGCMEELEISLTIQEMLNTDIESGQNAYNFKERTRQKIQSARRRLLRHRAQRIGGLVFLPALGLLLVGVIVLSILTLRSGGSLNELFRAENVKKHLHKGKETSLVVETEFVEESNESLLVGEELPQETEFEEKPNEDLLVGEELPQETEKETEIETGAETETQ